MANKELAVTNSFVVTKTPQGPWTPGTPSWVKISSTKAKANGETILVTTLSWTMSGCVFAPNTFTTGGGSIPSTASKCKCELQLPLRKGDSGMCSGVFMTPAPPTPVPVPCSCSFEITDSGQTKAKGE